MISIVRMTDEITEAAQALIQRPDSSGRYLLLDMAKIGRTERRIFKSIMEIMALKMQIEFVNKYLESAGAKNTIPSSILNNVIDHALRKEPFSDKDLEEYFNLQKAYKEHAKHLDNFSSTPELYFDTDLDIALLGASFEDQWDTEHMFGSQDEFYSEIQDEIITITESFNLGLVDYKTFIKKAKQLVSLITEEVERLNKNRNTVVYKIKEIPKK